MKYLNHRLSAAMWARVLLLWLTLAVGALVLGGISLGLGRFVQDNIRTELTTQQISFSPAEGLSDEERRYRVSSRMPGNQWLQVTRLKFTRNS